jgi:hypothetical protein
MTVRDLVQRLTALSNSDAEVLVQVPNLDDIEVPDNYTIEDVVFVDWPEHYTQSGDALGVAKFSRAEACLKV